jgi:hypothetical protein
MAAGKQVKNNLNISLRMKELWNQTEMFYNTSLGWKAHDLKHHEYVDDVLFIGFGIEGFRTAGIDILAGDLLGDPSLRSSL